jgi:hypothetical protein
MNVLQRLGITSGHSIDERVIFLMDTARMSVTMYEPHAYRNVMALRRRLLKQLSSDDHAGIYYVEVVREAGTRPARYMIEADNEADAVQCAQRLETEKGYQQFVRIAVVLMKPTNDDQAEGRP